MRNLSILFTGTCLFLAVNASAQTQSDVDSLIFASASNALEVPDTTVCHASSGVCSVAAGPVGTCCSCFDDYGTRQLDQLAADGSDVDPKLMAIFSGQPILAISPVVPVSIGGAPLELHPKATGPVRNIIPPPSPLPPIY